MSIECLFCKIVSNTIKSFKVWEDESYMAFLDIYPNVKGQTLVVPKKHVTADLFTADKEYTELMKAARTVAKKLSNAFNCKVAMIIEGLEIDHAHVKLYPLHGTKKDGFTSVIAEKEVFFEKYPGYVTSLHGPRASEEELEIIMKKLAEQPLYNLRCE